MTLRTLTAIVAAFVFLALGAAASPDVITTFLQTRASQPLLPPTETAAALQNPAANAGKSVEATASVSGIITSDGDSTALLSIGAQSVTVAVPPSLRDASWMASGALVRVLLSVTETGELRLLAAAPDSDIAAAEARLSAALPSRSLPYDRSGRRGFIATQNYGQAQTYGQNYGLGGGHPIAALSPRALAIYGPYCMAIRSFNPSLSEADVNKITTSILYFSDQNNIDPRLTVAMIIAESGFDPSSTSRTGAMGLGQLMPSTARGLGVTDAYDPVQNIGAAVHLLRGHLDKYGGAPANAGVIPFNQIALTMAAYNAGPGAVKKYHGVPPYRETRRYVARVAALYKKMCGGSAEVSAQ